MTETTDLNHIFNVIFENVAFLSYYSLFIVRYLCDLFHLWRKQLESHYKLYQ